MNIETSYMLDSIDGKTYNVVLLDDGPDSQEAALNKFKDEGPDIFIVNIREHYRRLVGPGVPGGLLDAD